MAGGGEWIVDPVDGDEMWVPDRPQPCDHWERQVARLSDRQLGHILRLTPCPRCGAEGSLSPKSWTDGGFGRRSLPSCAATCGECEGVLIVAEEDDGRKVEVTNRICWWCAAADRHGRPTETLFAPSAGKPPAPRYPNDLARWAARLLGEPDASFPILRRLASKVGRDRFVWTARDVWREANGDRIPPDRTPGGMLIRLLKDA